MLTSSSTRPSVAPTPPRVVGCTCFRVRRLARRVTQIYDRTLAPIGLRVTQFSVLSQLVHRDDLPMSALADALDMDRTSLTRNLKPLVAADLVSLDVSQMDARVRVVRVTPAGRARHAEAKRLWRVAQNEVNQTLGEVQVASLHATLDGLIDAFNARNGG